MKTVGCMANRQIARELRVAPSTIDRQLARLGRHCLLYHTQQMQDAKPASTVAIDGFVTFEHSQFWPFHHHPAVEPESDFIVYFTDSEVRRSGSMTDAQKRKRERLEQQYGRPDPTWRTCCCGTAARTTGARLSPGRSDGRRAPSGWRCSWCGATT
ncbi:MAG: helix-turn-helix domain-containing protein [bacterium]|nr:helix-turn-helix domain-containing protein [bacterium]